jgi:predicted lysophospholipase L1 biosynthesis ABC-type transport system permease subunit
MFPDGGALWRQLAPISPETSGGRPITVVGLLPDVRQRNITIPAYPEIWLPQAQQRLDPDVYISARTIGDPETLVATIRRIIAQIDPELEPRRLSTMDAIIDQTLAPQRYVLSALVAFTALALILAALGLYAVIAYLTAVRAREIGVRIALGEGSNRVIWSVLRHGLRLAAVGVAIGLPIAYASSRVMTRFLYDVQPRDAQALLLAPAVLALVALAATLVPARRAARVDPLTALRGE